MFEDVNFYSGSVTWNLSYNPNGSIEEQLLSLGEDLFQVNYDTENTKYTIDVGWYPESSVHGSFRIVIIKNCNWEDFLYDKRTRDYGQLHRYMEECVDIVIDLIDKYEETVSVINQLKEIIWTLHCGEIPEGESEADLFGEVDLALSSIYGVIKNKKTNSENKKYVDVLVSIRMKNLNDLSKQVNLEDYPQMHLNFLIATYAIKLLEKQYQ